jgi:hypothetical protein
MKSKKEHQTLIDTRYSVVEMDHNVYIYGILLTLNIAHSNE